MAAEKNDSASNLEIPEGYAVEPLEDGRLAVYEASTGVWLGHFSPSLSIAQEVLKDLIDVHEEEEERKEVLSDLLIAPPVPGEVEEAAGNEVREVLERTEEPRPTGDAADTARADALRIRELEIVTGLAVDALREAGDEATAEVVRQVLDSGVE